jgi:hypothetical protein
MISPTRRNAACALVAGVAFASLGCESSTVCAALPAWALEITVIDSITRVTPTATSTLTVRDSDFVEVDTDSLAQRNGPFTFVAANGRPGVYAVLIQTPGYRDWSANDLVVHAKQCGVKTVKLTALLQTD